MTIKKYDYSGTNINFWQLIFNNKHYGKNIKDIKRIQDYIKDAEKESK